MKIATLTTFFANNYGALLQCHALLHVLNEDLGYDAETIAYYPANADNSWSVFYPCRSFRNIIKNLCLITNITLRKARKSRIKANKQFIAKNIRKSAKIYNPENISEVCDEYEAIICGSDQIWNHSLFPSTEYFLGFIPPNKTTVKRISYAASVCEPFSEKFLPMLKTCLHSFDAVSVREPTDVEIVQPYTKCKVSVMPDPVFLPDPFYWQKISIAPPVKEKYIFCYFIGSERLAAPIVNEVRKKTGYKVINLATGFKNSIEKAECPMNVGPYEFIGYIKNASIVLTNSFHCIAFSLIFNKCFYTCGLNHKRQSRIDNIMQRYCCEDNRNLTTDNIDAIKQGRISFDPPKIKTDSILLDREKGIDFLKQTIDSK